MSQAPPTLSCPYKGLVPYSEEDAQFFFGREDIRDNIIASMQAFRLTLLYGASGVGKSSVLRAGVVHRLRQLAAEQLDGGERPEFCVVVYNRWGEDPVKGLLNDVRSAVGGYFPGLPPLQPAATLSATLEQWADEIKCDLFIVLDQFEEYFLYHQQEDGVGTFAQEFPRAVNNNNLRASFLISIREDALAKLDRFQPRLPNIFRHSLRVMPLQAEEARKAIELPLTRYNELNAGRHQVTAEPGLVAAILRDVQTGAALEDDWTNVLGGDAPRTQIEAPYLQQVLTRLWTADAPSGALRLATYSGLGGGKKIVSSHLSRTIEQLDPSEQQIAARVFRYLVTPSGTKIAQTAKDLAQYGDLSPDAVTAVLGKLSGTEIRILRAVAPPPDQPGAMRYEIFHDVLAAPINAWWKKYEAQEREEERLRQERESIAAENFTREQEADSKRYRRRLVWAAGVAVALLGLSVYAFQQQVSARNAEMRAVAAQAEAERSRDDAFRERDSARIANQVAEAKTAEAQKAQDEAEKARDEAEVERTNALAQRKAAEAAKADALRQKAVAVEEAARARTAESDLSRADQDLKRKQEEVVRKQDDLEKEIIRKNQAVTEALKAQAQAETTAAKLRKTLTDLEVARDTADKQHQEAERQRRQKLRAVELTWQADKQMPYLKGAMRGYGSKRNEGATGRQGPPSYPRNAAVSPDAKYVVTTGNDGRVRLWETVDPYKEPVELNDTVLATDMSQYHYVTSAIGQKSRQEMLVAATAYKDRRPSAVGVWRITLDDNGQISTRKLIHTLEGHTDLITALAFYSDVNFLVSGSRDGTARIWNLGACTEEQASCPSTPLKPEGVGQQLQPIVSVAVSRDNSHVATGDTDGITRLWACDAAGRCKAEKALPKRSTFAITSIDFSGDGQQLVTASEDGTARVWNLKGRKREATLHERWELTVKNKRFPFPFDFDWRGRKRPVMTGAAFISDTGGTKYVVTSSADGKVKVWDVNTGLAVLDLKGHIGRVNSATYSPHGKFIVTAGNDDTVRIWEPCAAGWESPELGKNKARANFRRYCNKSRAVSELKR